MSMGGKEIINVGNDYVTHFNTGNADGSRADPSEIIDTGDIFIYKDDSTSPLTPGGGSLTVDDSFDAKVDLFMLKIDTSLDSGNFSAGSDFTVLFMPPTATVDGKLVSRFIGKFRVQADTSGYYGAIWYDSGVGNSGTVFGVDGTALNPVSDSESAKSLMVSLGTKLIIIEGNFTLQSNWHDLATFRGRGLHSVVVGNGQDGGDNVYTGIVVTGIQLSDDETIFTDCLIDGAEDLAGISRGCIFKGNITVGNNITGFLAQVGAPLLDSATFTMAGPNRVLRLQQWSGDLTIQTMNDATAVARVILAGGTLTILNCTLGNIEVSGEGEIVITGTTGTAIDQSGMGVQHWQGLQLNIGPNMIENDGASNPRWTKKALEEVDGSNLQTDLTEVLNRIGEPVSLDGGIASLSGNFTKIADDNDGADFDASFDSLEKQVKAQFVKGVAYDDFTFLMVSNSDHVTGVPSLVVSASIIQDDGAIVALTNIPIDKTAGIYQVDLTLAEMTADSITLIFTGTGADDRVITFPTNT